MQSQEDLPALTTAHSRFLRYQTQWGLPSPSSYLVVLSPPSSSHFLSHSLRSKLSLFLQVLDAPKVSCSSSSKLKQANPTRIHPLTQPSRTNVLFSAQLLPHMSPVNSTSIFPAVPAHSLKNTVPPQLTMG